MNPGNCDEQGLLSSHVTVMMCHVTKKMCHVTVIEFGTHGNKPKLNYYQELYLSGLSTDIILLHVKLISNHCNKSNNIPLDKLLLLALQLHVLHGLLCV